MPGLAEALALETRVACQSLSAANDAKRGAGEACKTAMGSRVAS